MRAFWELVHILTGVISHISSQIRHQGCSCITEVNCTCILNGLFDQRTAGWCSAIRVSWFHAAEIWFFLCSVGEGPAQHSMRRARQCCLDIAVLQSCLAICACAEACVICQAPGLMCHP